MKGVAMNTDAYSSRHEGRQGAGLACSGKDALARPAAFVIH